LQDIGGEVASQEWCTVPAAKGLLRRTGISEFTTG